MTQKIKDFIEKHKLVVLVSGVIIASCVLVSISMSLYYRSDAYRIDLSRPEFKESREKIVNEKSQNDDFSATGEVTEDTLHDFYARYDELSKQIFDAKAFSNDVLSDKELSLVKRSAKD